MLSAILTPYIVFWASDYNFKMLRIIYKCQWRDKSIGACIFSGYLALLSFPVIGIIFTIIEIIRVLYFGFSFAIDSIILS